MSEIKKIQIQIKSNIDETVTGVKGLTSALKDTNQAATDLDATFEEVYGDLQPLTTRMGEAEDRLYELGLAGKQTSKEYQDLLQSVGNYRRVQIQTDMAVDAASSNLGQKLTGALSSAAGGFQLAQGAMGLFGTESKDVEEGILKVQSAMAITSGIQTISEGAKSVRALNTAVQATTVFQKASTAAQWLWNAAMAANPIGALVVAIGAVLVGGYKLVKFFQDSSAANEAATRATNANTSALKRQNQEAAKSSTKLETYNTHQYNLAEAAGASGEELRKLALKHKDEEVALNKKNAVLAQSTFLRERDTLASLKNAGASDEVIAAQEKLVQDTYKSFKKQNELLSNSYKERRQLVRNNEVAEVAERTASRKRIDEVEGSGVKKTKGKSQTEINAEEEKAFQKGHKEWLNQLDEEAFASRISKGKAAAAEEKQLREASALESATAAVEDLEATEENGNNKLYLTKAFAEKETSIKKENAEKQKEIDNIAFENRQRLLGATADGLNILSDIMGKETGKGKALAVAGALINTYAAIAGQLKAFAGIPIPGYAIAQAIATGLSGFAAVKNIMAVKVPGGQGSGGSTPAIGASSAPAVSAPQFNLIGSSGTNQIAQAIGSQGTPVVKAYVTSTDVSTAQSLDRNRIEGASI
jgi:hypothetical protein